MFLEKKGTVLERKKVARLSCDRGRLPVTARVDRVMSVGQTTNHHLMAAPVAHPKTRHVGGLEG